MSSAVGAEGLWDWLLVYTSCHRTAALVWMSVGIGIELSKCNQSVPSQSRKTESAFYHRAWQLFTIASIIYLVSAQQTASSRMERIQCHHAKLTLIFLIKLEPCLQVSIEARWISDSHLPVLQVCACAWLLAMNIWLDTEICYQARWQCLHLVSVQH